MIARLKEKLSSSDIAKRLAVGAGWQVTSTVFSKAIIMAAGIICARILGKEIYGQFGMVKSTVGLLMSIGGAGLGLTATKYISQYRASDAVRTLKVYYVTNLFAIIVALLSAVIVFSFAEVIAAGILNCPDLVTPIRFASVIIFVVTINAAQDGVIAGFEDFKSRARNNVVSSLAQGGCMVLGAHYYSLIGAVTGYAIGVVILVVCNKLTIDADFKRHVKQTKHKLRLRWTDFKVLYTYSLPATVSTILAAPTFWIVRTILVQHTGGFGDVAIFDVADQWKTLILFVPAAVCQVAMPILSSIDDDRSKFWKVLNSNILLNVGIALVMVAVVALFSPFILSLYGKGFDDFWPLVILSASCVFTAASTILGVSISSLGWMWTWCFFNVLWAANAIFLTWLFVGKGWGASGVAWAVLIAYFFHASLQYVYLRCNFKCQSHQALKLQ